MEKLLKVVAILDDSHFVVYYFVVVLTATISASIFLNENCFLVLPASSIALAMNGSIEVHGTDFLGFSWACNENFCVSVMNWKTYSVMLAGIIPTLGHVKPEIFRCVKKRDKSRHRYLQAMKNKDGVGQKFENG